MTGGRHLGRALGWLGGGVFASAALQYLLFFAAARWLGVVDYGTFSLALTVAVIAAPFCDLGTSVSIVCTGARDPARLPNQLGAALLLRALTALPVGLFALAIGLGCGYGAAFAELLPPLFVAALADGVGNLASAACQAEERMATAALLQVVRNLLRGMAVLVTLWCGGGPHGLAAGFAAASVFGALAALRVTARGRRLPMARAELLPTVRAALPFGAAILATSLHAQLGIALLGSLDGDAAVGRYHAALRFVLLLQMLPQVVALATAPRAFRDGVRDPAAVFRIQRLKLAALAPLGLLAALTLASGSSWLVEQCLGSSFAGSAPLLFALAPLPFVKFVTSALADTVSAIGRQRLHSLGCWLALGMHAILAMVAIPRLGSLGTALAALLSEGFLLVFLAAALDSARAPGAWGGVLRHSLWAATAAAAAAVLTPRLALPAAAVTLATLMVWSPSAEERQLFNRRGATT